MDAECKGGNSKPIRRWPRSARVHSLSIQLSRNMLRRIFAAATGTLSSPAYEYHAEVRFRPEMAAGY